MKLVGMKNKELERDNALATIDEVFTQWLDGNTPKGYFATIYADKLQEAKEILKTGEIPKRVFYIYTIEEAQRVLEKAEELKAKIAKMETYRLAVKDQIRNQEHVPDIHALVSNFIKTTL